MQVHLDCAFDWWITPIAGFLRLKGNMKKSCSLHWIFSRLTLWYEVSLDELVRWQEPLWTPLVELLAMIVGMVGISNVFTVFFGTHIATGMKKQLEIKIDDRHSSELERCYLQHLVPMMNLYKPEQCSATTDALWIFPQVCFHWIWIACLGRCHVREVFL